MYFQVAHKQSEKADIFCRQLFNPNTIQSPPKQGTETQPPKIQAYIPGTSEQSAPVMYTRQMPQSEDTKSTAAAVAAKLTASTSSAEMLTYVLSSLASEGVIGNSPSNDYPAKRTKINNEQPQPYIPSSQNAQPPVPPFPDQQQPPPPSSPPPVPPMPPMQPYPMPQYMHQPPPQAQQDGYQNYQIEGGFYGQQSAMPMAPMSRQ